MEGKLATDRRFFKFMMPGFHNKLNLPPDFCEHLKREKLERAIVKSCRGTWEIKISRNRNGLLCFEDGWPIFVHHHGLNIGDCVLFVHTGNFHFDAFVFDPSGCEKEFLIQVKKEQDDEESPPKPVTANNHSRNTKTTFSRTKERPQGMRNDHPKPAKKESGITYHSKNPHFIVTMKPSNAHKRSQVITPSEFAKSNNFGQMGRSVITLKDPRGKTWPVRLWVRGRCGSVQCRMGGGDWHDFYVSNKLKEGDVCAFDLIMNCHSKRPVSTVLLNVKIFRAPLQDID